MQKGKVDSDAISRIGQRSGKHDARVVLAGKTGAAREKRREKPQFSWPDAKSRGGRGSAASLRQPRIMSGLPYLYMMPGTAAPATQWYAYNGATYPAPSASTSATAGTAPMGQPPGGVGYSYPAQAAGAQQYWMGTMPTPMPPMGLQVLHFLPNLPFLVKYIQKLLFKYFLICFCWCGCVHSFLLLALLPQVHHPTRMTHNMGSFPSLPLRFQRQQHRRRPTPTRLSLASLSVPQHPALRLRLRPLHLFPSSATSFRTTLTLRHLLHFLLRSTHRLPLPRLLQRQPLCPRHKPCLTSFRQ